MPSDSAPPYTALPSPDLHAEFYADVPTKRLLAWIVDTILTIVITLLIIPFTAFTALFFLPLLFLSVNFIYRAVTIARKGATPGMQLLAIAFHDHSGGRPTPGVAVLHTLIYVVSSAMVLPQVISIVTMLLSPRGQSLGDMVLGTVALNRAARV